MFEGSAYLFAIMKYFSFDLSVYAFCNATFFHSSYVIKPPQSRSAIYGYPSFTGHHLGIALPTFCDHVGKQNSSSNLWSVGNQQFLSNNLIFIFHSMYVPVFFAETFWSFDQSSLKLLSFFHFQISFMTEKSIMTELT